MLAKTLLVCHVIGIAASKLVVYSPQELVNLFKDQDSVIPANYANFGHIPYGQSLIGSIYYDA